MGWWHYIRGRRVPKKHRPAQDIRPTEGVLLQNLSRAGQRMVSEVMVPRADITSIDIETPLDEVVRLLLPLPHSRYPVHVKDSDAVTGMIHIKDVFKSYLNRSSPFSLDGIKRPILFISPSMHVLDLLVDMRTSRTHMALVVDEYGGVDGLVTIEDLVEEVVGEIQDEYDVEVLPRMVQAPDGQYRVSARFPLKEFAQHFSLHLDEEEQNIDTLGGFVFNLAGAVPEKGSVITHDPSGMQFEILDADPRTIKSLGFRCD